MGPEKNADLLHGGNATYCGSCYGAGASDEECCNTCDEARGLVPSPCYMIQGGHNERPRAAACRSPGAPVSALVGSEARGAVAGHRAVRAAGAACVTGAHAVGQLMSTGGRPACHCPARLCARQRGALRAAADARARARRRCGARTGGAAGALPTRSRSRSAPRRAS